MSLNLQTSTLCELQAFITTASLLIRGRQVLNSLITSTATVVGRVIHDASVVALVALGIVSIILIFYRTAAFSTGAWFLITASDVG